MDFSKANSSLGLPPDIHEFELSIFGPGVGECILLHLGCGDWFVIDSCLFPGSSTPVAIRYLESLGIDPATAIRRVLATHWHDDHIKGLSEVLHRCTNAAFIMSGALDSEQFLTLVYEVAERNKLVAATSTATELANILDQFVSGYRNVAAPDMFASDGSMLYQGGYLGTVSVQALSPSAETSANVASNLCTQHPTRQFKRLSPNHLSVAVQVAAGAMNLLLKADLEDTGQSHFGWKAVLNSQFRPQRKSAIVKVGHHGSLNADNNQVWTDMLSADPLSVVTPYSRLKVPLPTEDDLVRIRARTDKCFITTWPPSSRPIRRPRIDRFMAAATNVRKSLNRQPGFVRIRFDLNQSAPVPAIDLFGSALKSPL